MLQFELNAFDVVAAMNAVRTENSKVISQFSNEFLGKLVEVILKEAEQGNSIVDITQEDVATLSGAPDRDSTIEVMREVNHFLDENTLFITELKNWYEDGNDDRVYKLIISWYEYGVKLKHLSALRKATYEKMEQPQRKNITRIGNFLLFDKMTKQWFIRTSRPVHNGIMHKHYTSYSEKGHKFYTVTTALNYDYEFYDNSKIVALYFKGNSEYAQTITEFDIKVSNKYKEYYYKPLGAK